MESCPHCGGLLRKRYLVGKKLLDIVNRWLNQWSAPLELDRIRRQF
jgi:hypothetical protein